MTPGTRVGQYEIVGPLGAGGMGEVYRARDVRLGREVAIKMLPPKVAADQSRRDRFEREARHVAGLNHPNILVLYDIGTVDEMHSWRPSWSMATRCATCRCPPRKSLDVAAQIADALAAAHASGVTHRDLKPDNVMVSRDGRAKLLDFGIAKASAAGSDVDGGPDRCRLGRRTARIHGTGASSGRGFDHRTDIFAFGAVLYDF